MKIVQLTPRVNVQQRRLRELAAFASQSGGEPARIAGLVWHRLRRLERAGGAPAPNAVEQIAASPGWPRDVVTALQRCVALASPADRRQPDSGRLRAC